MTPERFLYYLLLIIAVVVAVFVAVWLIDELRGTDPALVLGWR